MKYRPYYKKIDRSILEYAVTIPKEYTPDFLAGKPLRAGTSRDISITFENKEYPAKFRHVKRKNMGNVYQLRLDGNKDLLLKLRKTFIQSYVILKGQKELFEANKEKGRRFFRGKLRGGEQEVLCIQPISPFKIEFSTFVKVEDDWNPLFERLAEENVFGWFFEKDRRYLIAHSTRWFKAKEFPKHSHAVNVIYYLANSKDKTLYIGKADILGNRVKPGRKHQSMREDWESFRYDIVHNEFSNLLERIEDHTIRSVASILNNTKGHPSLGISAYKLVNRNWKKL